MIQKRWFNILSLLLLLCQLYGQQDYEAFYQVRDLRSVNELKNTAISNVVVDQKGYYWIATDDGFHRFDGIRTVFFSRKSLGIPEHGHLFLENIEGALFTYTIKRYDATGGYDLENLSLFDPQSLDIHEVEFPSDLDLSQVRKIFVSGGKLLLFDQKGEVFSLDADAIPKRVELNFSGNINDIVYLSETNEFIVLSNNKCYRSSNANNGMEPIPMDFSVEHIKSVSNGFVAGQIQLGGDGIYDYHFYSGKQRNWVDFKLDESYLLGATSSNELGFRSGDQFRMLSFNHKGEVEENITADLNDLFASNFYPLRVTSVDDDFYFAFYDHIELVKLKPGFFKTHLLGEEHVSVRDIALFQDSLLFLSTYNGNRILRYPSLELAKNYEALFSDPIKVNYGLWATEDCIYSGLHGQGLDCYKPQELSRKRYGFIGDSLTDLSATLLPFMSSDNKLFVGLEFTGLALLDTSLGGMVLEQTQHLNTKLGCGINGYSFMDLANHVWLSTECGAYLLNTQKLIFVDTFPNSVGHEITQVRQIGPDDWAIIYKEGSPVLCWNDFEYCDTIPIFKTYLQNNIHDLVKDEYGNYWFPTNKGLYHYNVARQALTEFSMSYGGLHFDEFNKIGTELLPDGRILFGGIGGLLEVNPSLMLDEVLMPNEPKALVVSEIEILDGDHARVLNIQELASLKTLTLASNTQNISLGFSYLNPIEKRYQYFFRSKGSESWISLEQPELLLTELGYGKKSLEIAVKHINDTELLTTTEFHYQRLKPWYLKPWFLALFAACLFLLFLEWGNRRVDKVAREKVQLELEVQRRTQDILDKSLIVERQNQELIRLTDRQQQLFYLIGHELHSPLVSVTNLRKQIAYLLKKRDWEKFEVLTQQLEAKALATEKLLERLLDWGESVVLNNDQAQDLILVHQECELIVKQFVEEIKLKELLISIKIPSSQGLLVEREIFILIVRNIFSNAIKFSPIGGQIEIKFQRDNDTFRLSVNDQGIGLKQEQIELWKAGNLMTPREGTKGEKGFGIGLSLARKFAEQCGFEIVFDEEFGAGTIVSLVGPYNIDQKQKDRAVL